MSKKLEVIERVSEPGAKLATVCREFNISRETGHKWRKRYLELGTAGLEEESRPASPRKAQPTITPWRDGRLATEVICVIGSSRGMARGSGVAGMEVDDLVRSGIDRATAEAVVLAVAQAQEAEDDPALLWRWVSNELLGPAQPFELHRALHARVFANWPTTRGPAPTWVPGPRELRGSNLARAMVDLGVADYAQLHRLSLREPERYWAYVLGQLGVELPAGPVLDASSGPEQARWFVHARLNIAACALERGTPERPAVIFQREGGSLERRSLGEVAADSERVARGLAGIGITAGDAVAIAMPMTYEAVAIYLGVVRRGATVVSIADSFAASEIATRLRIGGAKLLFTEDVIVRGGKRLPLYARVSEAAQAVGVPLVVLAAEGRIAVELGPGDRSWDEFLAGGSGQPASAAEYLVQEAESVTNVLFSSGTTGEPKAIGWTQLTPIKAAADGWAHHDIRAMDVVCWPTNLGWMMGPWLIYASLLNGATMALYQGSPLGRDFGQFVADARVSMLGVVPSLVKTWKGSGCMEGLDWSSIRCFSSTGEASTPHEMHWLMARGGYKPVIEYCGGTEIGGGYLTGTVVQAQAPSTFSTPALGCSFVILDEQGRPCDNGELALVPPLLGSSNRLLNRDHHEVYFADMPRGPNGEVLRRHGDQVERLGGGYYRALGRVDDTMNLGGIKTSSAEIERVCNRVGGVLETAAIAVPPEGGGPSLLVIYCVLREVPLAARESNGAVLQVVPSQAAASTAKALQAALVQPTPSPAAASPVAESTGARASSADHQGEPSSSKGARAEPASVAEFRPDRVSSAEAKMAESSAAELTAAMQQAIRAELNPLFKIHEVVVVQALPRTASNKVMRRVLRAGYSSKGPVR